jgi:hypothetical protein
MIGREQAGRSGKRSRRGDEPPRIARIRREEETDVSYQPGVGQPVYQPSYYQGGYAPQNRSRPWLQTVVFAALIALIPFVGAGASAVSVERRHDPESFRLGAACGAAFLSVLYTLGFFVALGLVALAVYVGLSAYAG